MENATATLTQLPPAETWDPRSAELWDGRLLEEARPAFEADGFERYISFLDAKVIAMQELRCDDCGAKLEGVGWRSEALTTYRCFAACPMCGRIGFEY